MVNEFYMLLAISEAWKYQGLTYPNPAVGCVITDKNGAILSVAAHKKAGFAHAELEASREALAQLNPLLKFPQSPNELHAFILQNHQNLLKDSTFYVTLEPCSHQGLTPSCAELLCALHVKRVVIGARDNTKKARGGSEILQKTGLEVIAGVCEKECKELIEPFLLWQKGSFSFFKLAMRLDGSYDNGTITSIDSREFTHRLRDVCDLIVIGGETLRSDKPTLDSRLVNGKAPDVLICTQKATEKNAPLFNVKSRNVIMQNSLDFPKKYKNIMVEGGSNFLQTMKDKVNWFLIFYSNSFSSKGKQRVKIDLNLKLIYSSNVGDDLFCWYKQTVD
ncbi:MAG: bifunctional diaminohydroxyphosphoribosylaminopyrimidine deaminase/5-amino-6-(5-phosphoribosylamino)uracil reductase RibD [Campylobacteraceae bacterium]|jgi:diaminohydroxyphosphoribosylaminopyrimidine deaminase/5-amino-6-(5-phosphoribosylamino)uracil reductase|nr:bifunctional diaminohydroxyphosphoribosylaminopyrimidine deaminase/5-amino-6-(5-phosphoribosylamino)uracil reductase RibD [Campylobacteraceae bacterium]